MRQTKPPRPGCIGLPATGGSSKSRIAVRKGRAYWVEPGQPGYEEAGREKFLIQPTPPAR